MDTSSSPDLKTLSLSFLVYFKALKTTADALYQYNAENFSFFQVYLICMTFRE